MPRPVVARDRCLHWRCSGCGSRIPAALIPISRDRYWALLTRVEHFCVPDQEEPFGGIGSKLLKFGREAT